MLHINKMMQITIGFGCLRFRFLSLFFLGIFFLNGSLTFDHH